jgi:hypothetical protein
MAALYCAIGPDFVTRVIESGSHRWKAHHFQSMEKKPRRRYPLKTTTNSLNSDQNELDESPAVRRAGLFREAGCVKHSPCMSKRLKCRCNGSERMSTWPVQGKCRIYLLKRTTIAPMTSPFLKSFFGLVG